MSFGFLKSDCVEAVSFAQMRLSTLIIKFQGLVHVLVHFLIGGLSINAAFNIENAESKTSFEQ